MRTRLTNLGASSDSLAVIDPRRFLASSIDPSEEMEGQKPRRRGERSASTRRIQNTSMTSAMGSPARDTPSALSASATGPRERVQLHSSQISDFRFQKACAGYTQVRFQISDFRFQKACAGYNQVIFQMLDFRFQISEHM